MGDNKDPWAPDSPTREEVSWKMTPPLPPPRGCVSNWAIATNHRGIDVVVSRDTRSNRRDREEDLPDHRHREEEDPIPAVEESIQEEVLSKAKADRAGTHEEEVGGMDNTARPTEGAHTAEVPADTLGEEQPRTNFDSLPSVLPPSHSAPLPSSGWGLEPPLGDAAKADKEEGCTNPAPPSPPQRTWSSPPEPASASPQWQRGTPSRTMRGSSWTDRAPRAATEQSPSRSPGE